MPDPAYTLPDFPEIEYEVHLPNHPDVFRDWLLVAPTRRLDGTTQRQAGPEAEEARERLKGLWAGAWDEYVGHARSANGATLLLAKKTYLEARAVLPKGEDDDGTERSDAYSVARFQLSVLNVVLDRLGRDGSVQRWTRMGAFRDELWPAFRAPAVPRRAKAYLLAAEELYQRWVPASRMPRMTEEQLWLRIRERAGTIDPACEVEPASTPAVPGEAARSALRRLGISFERMAGEEAVEMTEVILRRAHEAHERLFVEA